MAGVTREPTNYTYDSRLGGLGPQWAYIGLPAALALGFVGLRRRRALVFAVLLPFALAFALQPARWWSRFTITLCALGALATVWLIEWCRPKGLRAVLQVGVLAVVGWSLVYSFPRRTITTFDVTLAKLRDVHGIAARHRTFATLVRPDFGFVDQLPRESRFAVGGHLDQYGAWNGDSDLLYPFFGSDWSRHLSLVTSTDPAGLRRDLRRAKADYLAAIDGSSFDQWARRDPSHFALVFTNAARHVWKFLPSGRVT